MFNLRDITYYIELQGVVLLTGEVTPMLVVRRACSDAFFWECFTATDGRFAAQSLGALPYGF